MSVFHHSDGTYDIIRDNDDLIKMIRERFGFEIAHEVQKLADVSDIEQQKMDSDFSSYESQNEGMHTALKDISDNVGAITAELEAPRINKKKIQKIMMK